MHILSLSFICAGRDCVTCNREMYTLFADVILCYTSTSTSTFLSLNVSKMLLVSMSRTDLMGENVTMTFEYKARGLTSQL